MSVFVECHSKLPPPHVLHDLFVKADADHGGTLDFEECKNLYRQVDPDPVAPTRTL